MLDATFTECQGVVCPDDDSSRPAAGRMTSVRGRARVTFDYEHLRKS